MTSRHSIPCWMVPLLFCSLNAVSAEEFRTDELTPLPEPITNNAVAAVNMGGSRYVVSFAGLAAGKTFANTLDSTWVLNLATGDWAKAQALPGGSGRLASVAATAGSLVYVFGGYSVAENGSEVSMPWVHAFNAVTGEFSERRSMTVPVDDALAVTFEDRYIYLISGWHDHGNVNLVQRYDSESDSWVQATPIPGRAVFGHAGGIVGNRVFYCDGVAIKANSDRAREFVANSECFLGLIDEDDSRRIDWRKITPHPGLPRYRMASVGVPELNAVLFIGGSENPYNYDGIGYNGRPAAPVPGILLFELDSLAWRVFRQFGEPSMDHRGLVAGAGGWITVGGMLNGQNVSNRVTVYRFGD